MPKIILSRKGFDSGNSDIPSAFVEDGEMVSFPIPADRDSPRARSAVRANFVRYDEIRAEGESLTERIRQLRRNRKKPFPSECCHHDPDLIRDARRRPSLDGWSGIFGQSGQSWAELKPVGVGDLFIFFGWFKQAEKGPDGMLRFRSGAPNLHACFGYLQVGEVLQVRHGVEVPECFADHPHLVPERLELQRQGKTPKKDAVFIASETLSSDKKLPGWGVFRHSPELVLTAEGQNRTVWKLPEIFRNRNITYHTDTKKYGWQPDGFFKSASRGQEFVVDDHDNAISEWAANLIRRHYLRS